MPSKKKGQKPKSADVRSVLLNLRVTPEEYLAIKSVAGALAGGNVSAWIRQRVLKEDPELSVDMVSYFKDRKDNPQA